MISMFCVARRGIVRRYSGNSLLKNDGSLSYQIQGPYTWLIILDQALETGRTGFRTHWRQHSLRFKMPFHLTTTV